MDEETIYGSLTTMSEIILMIRDEGYVSTDPKALEIWETLNARVE